VFHFCFFNTLFVHLFAFFVRGARTSWRKPLGAETDCTSTGNTNANSFDTSPFSSNTQIKAGPPTTMGKDRGVASAILPPAPASGAPAPASKATGVPPPLYPGAKGAAGTGAAVAVATGGASTKPGMVRFNGASMQLQPVSVPIPPTPPRVTVSTSSGARLLAPQQALAEEGEGGASSSSFSSSGASFCASESVVGGYAEVGSGAGPGPGPTVDAESSVAEEDLGKMTLEEGVPAAAATTTSTTGISSFEMSDDGAAMLFSTG
jgi:hypothetical protein